MGVEDIRDGRSFGEKLPIFKKWKAMVYLPELNTTKFGNPYTPTSLMHRGMHHIKYAWI